MTKQIDDSKTTTARFRSGRENLAILKTNHESRCSASVRSSARFLIWKFSCVSAPFQRIDSNCNGFYYFRVPLASGPPFDIFCLPLFLREKRPEKQGYLLHVSMITTPKLRSGNCSEEDILPAPCISCQCRVFVVYLKLSSCLRLTWSNWR